MSAVFLLVVLVAASLLCLSIALRTQKSQENFLDRLNRYAQVQQDNQAPARTGIEPLPAWAQEFARYGEKLAGQGKGRGEAQRLLNQAGFVRPGSLGVYFFIKAALGLGLALVVLFVNGSFSLGVFAAMLAAYVVGGIFPEYILKIRAARRYKQIERAMPDALDLMVICSEAGLPFTRIVQVVSRELKLSAPVLAYELEVTHAELEILPDRMAALKNLAERTQVQSVESMVSTLLQAEKFGTPLSQALHNIAKEARTTLILTLEERAGKLPARLSIPLMTLILPPVVAIVAAPAFMRVLRSLAL